MSKIEEIGELIAECLNRCRTHGYSLATLIRFLDELRADGQNEVDVQRVDFVMRHILLDLHASDRPGPISEPPTGVDPLDTQLP